MIQNFDSDGVSIAFRVVGEGEPIVLIHGFASNHSVNWVDTSWLKTLSDAGRRVMLIDNRGHGASEKLYDKERYGAPEMAEDARRLLDHLGISSADIMGYSMGARITAFLALNHPRRVRSAIFGGLGRAMIDGIGAPEPIAAGLEAKSIDDVTDPTARAFRRFAELTRSDLNALAACMRSARLPISEETVADIACPVLVAVGADDPISGTAAGLADLIGGARALEVVGKDHTSMVGALDFKNSVIDFLTNRT